ncbi:MAG: protein-glutamate methylesterase/protein-glutamine glutaminase [Beijerinckiaceae bacterium]
MSIAVASTPALSQDQSLRVMIVDDAVVVRGLMARWFEEAGGITVASTHRSGAEAVAAIERVKPDVVILDIEMPDMDGITALPLLLKKAPGTIVIVASTLTTRNADVSLRCLQLGAIDYIAKPSTNRDVTFSADFRREVVEKVKTLGRRKTSRSPRLRMPEASREPAIRRPEAAASLVIRPVVKVRPNALFIGASTGGPQAVTEFLKGARPALDRMPVVIAQHMPATFTAMFADHLSRVLSVTSAEARHMEPLEKGRIYVAPGGRHLRVERSPEGARALIEDTPPVNFCRPSVDVTFGSAAQVYGQGALGVMLTGMGSDGLGGSSAIVERGGNIIAQDEESSVVWGMPGAVAKRGLCAAVDTVPNLARIVNIMAGADRS